MLNVQVPFYFKEIVDTLNVAVPMGDTGGMVMTIAGSVLLGCMFLSLFFSYSLVYVVAVL